LGQEVDLEVAVRTFADKNQHACWRLDSAREGIVEGSSPGNYLLLVDYTARIFRQGKAILGREWARQPKKSVQDVLPRKFNLIARVVRDRPKTRGAREPHGAISLPADAVGFPRHQRPALLIPVSILLLFR
jgi:hypothetical protein